MDTSTIVRNAQMDLLIELDRICKKHDIPYFLTYGTLLGAIRHDGFIPWDDDLDVGMRWDHYEKFCALCAEELDGDYMLHSWNSDPNSPHPFAKLKIRGTHYPEKLAKNSGMNDAVYIDLFPYDGVSQHKLLRKLQGLESYLLRKLLLLRCRFDLAGESRLRKLIYGAMTLVCRVQSLESLRKTMLRVRNRYNNGKATHVVCMCSCYSFERECVPSQMLADTVSHKFENGSFSIPREYDRFLRQIYGDYMQLPPEEERVGRHEIQGLDMGEYAIRYGGEK